MKTLLLALMVVGSVAHAGASGYSYEPSQDDQGGQPGVGYWCDFSYQNSSKAADHAAVVDPITLKETSKGVFAGSNILGEVKENGTVKLVVDTNQNTMTISHVEAGQTLTKVSSGQNTSASIVFKKTVKNASYDVNVSCGRLAKPSSEE